MVKMTEDKLAEMLKRFPAKELENGNFRTPPARLSYSNIFEKSRGEDGYTSQYGATLLFPKAAKLDLLQQGIIKVAKEFHGAKAGSMGLRLPFRDQGEKGGRDGYVAGAKFFRANSKQKPGAIGMDGAPILDASELVSGDWIIATVRFFGYTTGGKGVAAGLQNVIKVASDEPFGGVPASPEDDFADVLGSSAGAAALFDDEDEKEDAFSF